MSQFTLCRFWLVQDGVNFLLMIVEVALLLVTADVISATAAEDSESYHG